jgi:hypothetical protein
MLRIGFGSMLIHPTHSIGRMGKLLRVQILVFDPIGQDGREGCHIRLHVPGGTGGRLQDSIYGTSFGDSWTLDYS